ncbi:hypothetical protein [Streptomyces olivochromogenes]|uniref:hypothetical protein n=1 Tax=Streptomyces olivochromogenes TaxID=1963 RepID=UPI0035B250AD
MRERLRIRRPQRVLQRYERLYFRDLRDMIGGGQELDAESTVRVMSRYATVPATDFA